MKFTVSATDQAADYAAACAHVARLGNAKDRALLSAAPIVWGAAPGGGVVRFAWRRLEVSALVTTEALVLAGLRSEDQATAFLREARSGGDKTPVYVHGASGWSLVTHNPKRPVETVVLTDDAILRDVRAFVASEARYAARGIQHTRTYCLHGPPSAGKKTLAAAVAGMLDRPLAFVGGGVALGEVLAARGAPPGPCVVVAGPDVLLRHLPHGTVVFIVARSIEVPGLAGIDAAFHMGELTPRQAREMHAAFGGAASECPALPPGTMPGAFYRSLFAENNPPGHST